MKSLELYGAIETPPSLPQWFICLCTRFCGAAFVANLARVWAFLKARPDCGDIGYLMQLANYNDCATAFR
jgi:hypothetical protein